MTRVGWVLPLLATGCFVKPTRSGGGDGGTQPKCTSFSDWGSPVQIPIFIDPNDAATSPWLSDRGDELYFTTLTGGDPMKPAIMHAVMSNGAWEMPTAVQLDGATDDNPFLASDGTLWFDTDSGGVSGVLNIAEAPGGPPGVFGPPVLHKELTSVHEPALSRDRLALYAAPTGLGLVRFARNSLDAPFDAGTTLGQASGESYESPSVASDDLTIYFSAHTRIGERVYSAIMDTAHTVLGSVAEVGMFQAGDAATVYFDPNISRDDLTLVFASNIGNLHSRLWSVARTCTE